MSAADIQKQYKSCQCKDQVITQICVPEEHEPELMHRINLVLLGNLRISVPIRNSSSYLQGAANVSFLVLERLTTLSEYCSSVDRAADHLPAFPMGSDCSVDLALGRRPVQCSSISFGQPRQEIAHYDLTIWWWSIWQRLSENLIFTLSLAVLQ